jgi:hypothetical protein
MIQNPLNPATPDIWLDHAEKLSKFGGQIPSPISSKFRWPKIHGQKSKVIVFYHRFIIFIYIIYYHFWWLYDMYVHIYIHIGYIR